MKKSNCICQNAYKCCIIFDDSMYLSVILPVYNEVRVIRQTLVKIDKYLKDKGWQYEIIIINDGSTDQTMEEISQTGLAGLKIISFKENCGKGAAIKRGVLSAQGDLILFMDADYSTPINELDNFIFRLNEGYSIVIGSRALQKSQILKAQSKIKIALGRFGNILIQLIAVPGIKDTQCGFKLFTKRFKPYFNKQTIDRWGFDIELLFIARKHNFKIIETAVHWTNNFDSKVGPVDYFVTFLDLIKIRINNLKGIYD